jgi:MFS transporter, AAHS family, 3-hydroxyphenylpropionic acid transporter
VKEGNAGASAATLTIAFCLCAAFCEGIDLQAAGVAASGIAAEFRPSPERMGSFFSASTLGLFFGALIGGRLADSIGRKRVLVGSVAMFGVFSLLTAMSWDIDSLSWARLLTGLGLGGALPILIALVAENSRERRETASVAMVYAATPFGGAIASLLSLLLPGSSWRVIFIVGGVVPLLLVPLMAYGLQESVKFRKLRSMAGAGGAAAMPKSGSFAAIFSGGRALRTVLLWVSFFLELLVLYLLLNWLPTLMVGDGLTRVEAAGAQIGFNIGGAVAAVLMGYLLSGRLRIVSVIAICAALPLLLVALAKAPAQLTVVVAIVFALGCCVLAVQAFLYATAPMSYPTSIRGVGVGAAVAAGRIGSVVGPKLGGYLKTMGHGSSQLLMDLLPIVIAGSICALLLVWHAPRSRES